MPQHEHHPTIVVLAYNRPDALTRLLNSISTANFRSNQGIRLIISIDKSNNERCAEVATKYEWRYGEKEIILHDENLGMKAHSLFCGNLTDKYGTIIFLEDDAFVSPEFYSYALQAMEFYKDNALIAGVSLYNFVFNEFTKMNFNPIDDGYDNYFIQSATTWGVIWNKNQWKLFADWLEQYGNQPVTVEDDVPEIVASWPSTSWKKYVNKYLVTNNKYFVYPRISLLSSFVDVGIHNEAVTNNFQVPLLLAPRDFRFSTLEQSIAIYDSYFELMARCLKKMNSSISHFDFDIDIYGLKTTSRSNSEYLITAKKCGSYEKSFGCELYPPELNIVFDIKGDSFYLAKKANLSTQSWEKKIRFVKHCQKDLGIVMYVSLLIHNTFKLITHRLRKYF